MSHTRRHGRSGLVPIVVALFAATVGAGCASPAPRTGEPPTATPVLGSVAASLATDPSPSAERPTASLPTGSPVASPSGDLLLLAGRPGAMALELVSADRQRRRLPLPNPDVAWISADATGRVLITTRAGRAFLSGPITRFGAPSWRALPVTASGAAPGPLSFGTLSPDGSRAAFMAADYATTLGFEIVIVDLVSGATTRIQVPRPAEGAPPAWVDTLLLVLTRERGDAAGVTTLDPADGRLVTGPGPADESGAPLPSGAWTGRIAALSVSADGSTVAVAAADDDRFEIGPAVPWLAGSAAQLAAVRLPAGPDGSRSFAWLTLAPDGGRLAIVRTDADGDASAVTVHAARDGWQAQTQIEMPAGAVRAVVAWLP
jgi:hypothetical protein